MKWIGFKPTILFLAVLLMFAWPVPVAFAATGTNTEARSGSGASNVWYLPEGSTGIDARGYFETFILVANASNSEAHVRLWHQLETPCPSTGGDWPGADMVIPVGGRATLNMVDSLGSESPGAGHVWSVSTKVVSDVPVVAERSMYWNMPPNNDPMNQYGTVRVSATDSVGVIEQSKTWYFAEGSTLSTPVYGGESVGQFETWILVQNPNNVVSNVNISYQTPKGEINGPVFALPPYTRKTINVADTLPEEESVSTRVNSDNPVIAERAVYWHRHSRALAGLGLIYRHAAHASAGLTRTATKWFFPFGTVDAMGMTTGHKTYVLVQNPGNVEAVVKFDFFTRGKVGSNTAVVPARSRNSYEASELFPEISEWDYFSVTVSSSTPVVAEKVIYRIFYERLTVGPPSYTWAAGTTGLVSSSKEWFLAEGSTAGDFETEITVFNPGSETADVSIYYQTPKGEIKGPKLSLEPYSTDRVFVDYTVPNVPNEWSVSTRVISDKPIVTERLTSYGDGCATGSVGVPFSDR